MNQSEFSNPIELDPDLARLKAQVSGNTGVIDTLPAPPGAFVADINGETGAVTLTDATVISGISLVIVAGAGVISFAITGIDPIATKKSNLSAAVAPGVNDDGADGYAVGSIWCDTTADDAYICLDSTNGAAVWKKITP